MITTTACNKEWSKSKRLCSILAVRTRLELATSGVTGRHSNQTELPHQVFSFPNADAKIGIFWESTRGFSKNLYPGLSAPELRLRHALERIPFFFNFRSNAGIPGHSRWDCGGSCVYSFLTKTTQTNSSIHEEITYCRIVRPHAGRHPRRGPVRSPTDP